MEQVHGRMKEKTGIKKYKIIYYYYYYYYISLYVILKIFKKKFNRASSNDSGIDGSNSAVFGDLSINSSAFWKKRTKKS